MIALIGSDGSMGKRYQAILKHLGLDYVPFDRPMSDRSIVEAAFGCERVIIASPTHTHLSYLLELLPSKLPILCEKPVTKNIDEINELHAYCDKHNYSYNMVMQYKQLLVSTAKGEPSYYNYFRHGNDGLIWDCMQTIALAEGQIVLGEDSPVWKCNINGQFLNIRFMDQAYVDEVAAWVKGTLNQSMDEILRIHKKVHAFQRALDDETD